MIRFTAAVLALAASLSAGCGDADDWPRPKLTAIPAPPDVSVPPADAVMMPSGLAYRILKTGGGSIKPRPDQIIVVHYTGWTRKGEMFDSSVARGKPLTYPLGKLIPGWIEGMGMMTIGEKRRLWIPGALAYDGFPKRPQGMLVFDVELLDVR